MISFSNEEENKKRDKRLRLTTVPSTNKDRAPLQIYSLDKRKIAEELVERFTKNPQEVDSFDFKNLDLSQTNLKGLNLRVLGANALRQIDFTGCDMPSQNFSGMNLRGAKFKGAHLEGTHFEGANLEKANLNGATIARCNFEGAKASGVKMNGANAEGACLDGIFSGAEMNYANLTDTILGRGNFENAKMNYAVLVGAQCQSGANFHKAEMKNTKLNGTFSGANFTNAIMDGADMEGGHFEGAKFAKASTFGIKTAFAKVDSDAFEKVYGGAESEYGPHDEKLEVLLPKPSFNSKIVRLRAILNKLGPEAPNMQRMQQKQKADLSKKFPTLDIPM